MKRLVPVLAALACVLAFASPAQAQVDMQEVSLSPRLASTVTTIQPQCYYCTSLTVTAFNVLWPTSGTISQADATWFAFEHLGLREYSTAGTSITQAQFLSDMANKSYEELPPEIRTFVGTSDTSYTVSKASWSYMSAPDYYNFGDFYTLVFHQARKVITVEVNYEYEY